MAGIIVFLFIFLTIYGLINFFFYRIYTRAFTVGKRVVLIYLVFQTISPVLWRWLDKNGYTFISPYLAFLSLVWMGFVLYFLISGLLYYPLRLLFKFLKSKPYFFLTFFTALLLSIYSYFETLTLENHHYVIYTKKLPDGKRVRILHVSDLHLGPLMREDKVNIVIRSYDKWKPDILAVTGDFVDGNMKDLMHLADMFRSINPPLGKYAVSGNHEFYVGYEQAVRFMERAGFKVLKGEVVELPYLNIAGVDDDEGKRMGYKILSEEEVLKDIDPSKYTILLKHKPVVNKKVIENIDLQLSGHTHGGVLFFVGYLILDRIFETNRGIKEIGENRYIVVSKGIGTGGPPMRLLAPPDVNVIDIIGLSETEGQAR